MTATEARKRFYAVIAEVDRPGGGITITHGGLPKVVVVSFEEYEGWLETMEIMADTELAQGLLKDLKDIRAGKLHTDTISLAQLKKKLKL